MDNLQTDKEIQLSLFDNQSNEKQKKLDSIVDSINEKYGKNCITRAGKLNIDKILKIKEEQ